MASWITSSDNSVLLAVDRPSVLGVGSVTDAGEITLNHVSPDARFQGVSKALLMALAERARERGNKQCNLTSSDMARHFYRANGYTDEGPAEGKFGTRGGYPRSKPLTLCM